jgi:hypothetical protein
MANDGYSIPSGPSIQDLFWTELLDVITQLKDSDDIVMDDPDLNRLKGRAEGISWCLAVMLHSPGIVDINEIKDTAMERWEATRA